MEVLQELMNLGLVQIGSDDDRYASMLEASKEICTKIPEDKSLLVSMTRLMINSGLPDSNAVFADIESTVLNHWKTIRNTHVDCPRELYRSIAIHSINSILSPSEPELTAIVILTVLSSVRLGGVDLGPEKEIVNGIVDNALKIYREACVYQLGIQKMESFISGRFRAPRVGKVSDVKSHLLKKEDFLARIADAAGPSVQGGAGENANPHWPHQNPTNWANEFALRMADAIASAINLSAKKNSEQLANAADEEISRRLKGLSDVYKVVGATAVRSNILWWKQVKYSDSAQQSYRELDQKIASALMALDLAEISPRFSPESLAGLLQEACLEIQGGDLMSSVSEWVCMLIENKGLFDVFAESNDIGRVALLNHVLSRAIRDESYDVKRGLQEAGFSFDSEFKLTDLAVSLFWGAQISKLVAD